MKKYYIYEVKCFNDNNEQIYAASHCYGTEAAKVRRYYRNKLGMKGWGRIELFRVGESVMPKENDITEFTSEEEKALIYARSGDIRRQYTSGIASVAAVREIGGLMGGIPFGITAETGTSD